MRRTISDYGRSVSRVALAAAIGLGTAGYAAGAYQPDPDAAAGGGMSGALLVAADDTEASAAADERTGDERAPELPAAEEDAASPPERPSAEDDTASAPEQPAFGEPGQSAEDEDLADAQEARIDGQILMQDEDTYLVSTVLGANVYTPDGETIGEVNDVLFDVNGAVEGVVIGVGGFLGMGEKDVAIAFDRLEMAEVDGEAYMILATSVEQLENAPAFRSVADQRDEENEGGAEPEQPQQEQQPTY